MKKILLILIIIAVGAGGWFLYTTKIKEVPSTTTDPTPITVVAPEPSIPKNNSSSRNEYDVSKDFKFQIQNEDKINLENPVVSGEYALQNWSDENKGGQALLKYKEGKGWILISMGGGAWSVSDLVQLGVSASSAKDLLKESK